LKCVPYLWYFKFCNMRIYLQLQIGKIHSRVLTAVRKMANYWVYPKYGIFLRLPGCRILPHFWDLSPVFPRDRSQKCPIIPLTRQYWTHLGYFPGIMPR
jgi:hypothetical protein